MPKPKPPAPPAAPASPGPYRIFEEKSGPSSLDDPMEALAAASAMTMFAGIECNDNRILQHSLLVLPACAGWHTVSSRKDGEPCNYYLGPDRKTRWANGQDGGQTIEDAFAFTLDLENAQVLARYYAGLRFFAEIRRVEFRRDGVYLAVVEAFEPAGTPAPVEAERPGRAKRKGRGPR